MTTPTYLIAGDDDLLLQRATTRLIDDLRGDDPELDVELHDTSETEHLPEMRTASLFGGRLCVVLRGAEGLSGDLKAEVEAYVDDPSPEAVLVLVARGTGKIQRIAKAVKGAGGRIDVRTPADWDDKGWDRLVTDELRLAGRNAEASAIRAIRGHAGADPSAIASKVSQVVAATPAGEKITAAHVEKIIEGHGRQTGFAVADAIADRDPAGALVALRGALEAGEAPLALLGAIAYRFRQLLLVRAGAGASEAGISAGQHRRLTGIASRFHPGELAWCHDRVAQADVDLKGSELPDELVIELAVIELATSREPGTPWNPLATA